MAKIKVRKRPIVIEVEQFFYDKSQITGVFYPSVSDDGKTYIGDAFVVTAHALRVYLQNGDWIVPEPDGEHYYPVKSEIFEKLYETIEV